MRKGTKQIVTLLVVLISIFQTSFAQDRAMKIREKLLNRDSRTVMVTAHRGDWRNAPENSIPAIKNAIKMGVDIIEIDVQRTKDRKFILMHDETLDRTTTGSGKISDWTLDSIQTLKLKSGCDTRTREKVPTLEEVLLLVKGQVLITLDKADRYFDEVFALLEKTGTTQQVIMGGSKPAEEVKAQFGKYLGKVIYMPYVHLERENAEAQINLFVKDLNIAVFTLLYPDDTLLLPKRLKTQLAGKSLFWYNALSDTSAGGHDDDMSLENPDAGYGYLIDTLGTRIIQTDRPAYLLEYLREHKLHD
jgi:glycerophosphoryl diester phosphodiesterase